MHRYNHTKYATSWVAYAVKKKLYSETCQCEHYDTCIKGGGTGGARGAIAPPLFTDHLKIINYSDTQNGS